MNLQKYLLDRKKYIDKALDKVILKDTEYPEKLYEAVRYSLFAGGKRIRPILMMAACEAVGGKKEDVLYPALAIEMIHTYSLIHDDLPAMDDDKLRRGKPTCHMVYGNATAILAGDALLTEAFAIMSTREYKTLYSDKVALEIISDIALAAGYKGMVAGQMVDMEMQGKDPDFAKLEFLHIHKTGAILLACIKVGAKARRASDTKLKRLVSYGERIGLAFQIADDILDVVGKKSVTGKESGQDIRLGKVTYPKVVGLKESKAIAKELVDSAIAKLEIFGKEAEPLRAIARFIIERKK